jgi:hypothetical protein
LLAGQIVIEKSKEMDLHSFLSPQLFRFSAHNVSLLQMKVHCLSNKISISPNGSEKVVFGCAVEGQGLKCAKSAEFLSSSGGKEQPRSLQTWVVGQNAHALLKRAEDGI